jgi:hypothetical protein
MTQTLDRLPEMIEPPEETRASRLGRRLRRATRAATGLALGVLGASAPVALGHLREHGYSIVGLGLFDSAMFVHSLFTGLLVTGISLIVFEWKVTDEGE